MFESFPSLTRFSQGWTVTEKIDGTNAQIIVANEDDDRWEDSLEHLEWTLGNVGNLHIFAGSRTRLITPEADNMGFARFVQDNAQDLIEALGEGRHFGEWWGSGIQRNYGLKEKRFSLFNVGRWQEPFENGMLPDRVHVVPCLMKNQYVGDVTRTFEDILDGLKIGGSHAAPGFMDPEGIVMFHYPSKTSFKKTFDYDEAGKWAENQARKGQ